MQGRILHPGFLSQLRRGMSDRAATTRKENETWLRRKVNLGECFRNPGNLLSFTRQSESLQQFPHRISNGFLTVN